MLGIASLSEIVYRLGITNTSVILAEMCREMRSIIKRNNKYDAKDGIDIALCKINLNTNELEFSGAYNPVYIIRNKELIQLKADKIPVGTSIFEREPKFTNQDLKLQKDDCIYLFSDGFPDQLNPIDRKKYLARNFQNLLISISDSNMNRQKNLLENEFERWRNGGDQTDDLMILGIRV